MPIISPPISIRVTTAERDLLEAAAAQVRTTLSDFMRRKALDAAELELLDRRAVTIPVADWDRFEAWAHTPAKPVPALQRLSATRPAWQD